MLYSNMEPKIQQGDSIMNLTSKQQRSNICFHKKVTQAMWNRRGTIALVLAATLLPACGNFTAQRETAPSTAQENVTTAEVSNNTEELIGKTVTIRSEPIKKFGPNSFTLEDEQFFGSEPILVLNTSGKVFALPEDDDVEVQVTGEVRKFNVVDIEREYKLGLEPDAYRDYESKPAIIAQSIALAPKPGEITQNPEQYYGKRLAVTGEVEDLQSANRFTLDEDKLLGADDLLVINPNAKGTTQVTLNDGEKVAVTGVLRSFVVADLERDYDLTWDLNTREKLEAEYNKKPVLIADTVYPSAIPTAAN
jgi:hypothetical protein